MSNSDHDRVRPHDWYTIRSHSIASAVVGRAAVTMTQTNPSAKSTHPTRMAIAKTGPPYQRASFSYAGRREIATAGYAIQSGTLWKIDVWAGLKRWCRAGFDTLVFIGLQSVFLGQLDPRCTRTARSGQTSIPHV